MKQHLLGIFCVPVLFAPLCAVVLSGCGEPSSYSAQVSQRSAGEIAVEPAEQPQEPPSERNAGSHSASQKASPPGDDEVPAEVREEKSDRGSEAAASEQPAEQASKRQAPATSSPVPPAEGGVLDRTFDDLKFEMEKEERFGRSMLTGEIEQLAGRKIRIRGYILPTNFQTGITQFVLVRDNMECCFGPGAALYDCILVNMAPGKAIDYTTTPVAVEGRFSIDPLPGPDGSMLAIYHLEADRVE